MGNPPFNLDMFAPLGIDGWSVGSDEQIAAERPPLRRDSSPPARSMGLVINSGSVFSAFGDDTGDDPFDALPLLDFKTHRQHGLERLGVELAVGTRTKDLVRLSWSGTPRFSMWTARPTDLEPVEQVGRHVCEVSLAQAGVLVVAGVDLAVALQRTRQAGVRATTLLPTAKSAIDPAKVAEIAALADACPDRALREFVRARLRRRASIDVASAAGGYARFCEPSPEEQGRWYEEVLRGELPPPARTIASWAATLSAAALAEIASEVGERVEALRARLGDVPEWGVNAPERHAADFSHRELPRESPSPFRHNDAPPAFFRDRLEVPERREPDEATRIRAERDDLESARWVLYHARASRPSPQQWTALDLAGKAWSTAVLRRAEYDLRRTFSSASRREEILHRFEERRTASAEDWRFERAAAIDLDAWWVRGEGESN